MGDTLSIGMLIAFLSYKDQFTNRMDNFISTMIQLRMLSLHGERVADIAWSSPSRPIVSLAIRKAMKIRQGLGTSMSEESAFDMLIVRRR